jgi:hypothetical protein
MEAEFSQKKNEYNLKIKEQRQQQEEAFRQREEEIKAQNAQLEQARLAQEAEIQKKVGEATALTKQAFQKRDEEFRQREAEFQQQATQLEQARLAQEVEIKKKVEEATALSKQALQKQDEEFRRRELEFQRQAAQLEEARLGQDVEIKKKVEEATTKARQALQKEIEAQTAQNFGDKLRLLEEQKQRTQEELKESKQKELEFLRKADDFHKREEEMELEKQKAINAERARIQEEMRKTEDERFRLREEGSVMKMKEYEKQLADQKNLIEEMKRKAEQGSMQMQGEVQELALEELLRSAFPYDTVKEVGKGMRGADCILTVRNAFGQECGCIIFESKRTQAFGGDWIDKLKADMLHCKAEIAVIVSQAFPKDMDRFGERQGVYVCSFAEAKSLVAVLRSAILKLYEARKSQENKGDKMVALYDYLTSSEFMAPWNTMRESFQAFRGQLQKERDDFERNWKKKQKMLEMIINNSLQISGSIEGISGIEKMQWVTGAGTDESNLLLNQESQE